MIVPYPGQYTCALCQEPLTRVESPHCNACKHGGAENSLGHYECLNPRCVSVYMKGRTTICVRKMKEPEVKA